MLQIHNLNESVIYLPHYENPSPIKTLSVLEIIFEVFAY